MASHWQLWIDVCPTPNAPIPIRPHGRLPARADSTPTVTRLKVRYSLRRVAFPFLHSFIPAFLWVFLLKLPTPSPLVQLVCWLCPIRYQPILKATYPSNQCVSTSYVESGYVALVCYFIFLTKPICNMNISFLLNIVSCLGYPTETILIWILNWVVPSFEHVFM